jgi:PAS domain S-box-containing protein
MSNETENFDPEHDLARAFEQARRHVQDLEKEVATLRDSKGLAESLFELAPDAIFVVDSQGVLSSLNAQSERMFGYKREELVGQKLEVLVPERFRQLHAQRRQQYSHAPLIRLMGIGLDLYGRRKDGSEFPVDVMLSPITTSNGSMVMAVVRDISQHKEAQQQLATLNKQLLQMSEDQVQVLNKALQKDIERLESLTLLLAEARKKALQASAEKSAIVATISHELRTPLSGIIVSLELLMAGPSLQDEQIELLRTAFTQAQALLAIVNDLLDIARIEAGKFVLDQSAFSPSALIQEIVGIQSDAAQAKGLSLRTDMGPDLPGVVSGDRRRIRQVLLNLVGNAIKFTHSGEVCIKVRETGPMNEGTVGIAFAVRDTGIGISEENQKLLFQPFSQIDSSDNRKYGGTGLGLALSKNLVELMGGTIVLESKLGKGSEFSFTLPLRADTALTAEQDQSVVPLEDFRDKRVLVVEDNPMVQKLTVKQLLLLGLRPHVVSSGKEALDAKRRERFDLILMDCHLPDISGFDVTGKIRTAEAGTNDHTIIVAMTAGAMAGERERCISAGMDDYLSKPFSISQLRAKLKKWLAPADAAA